MLDGERTEADADEGEAISSDRAWTSIQAVSNTTEQETDFKAGVLTFCAMKVFLASRRTPSINDDAMNSLMLVQSRVCAANFISCDPMSKTATTLFRKGAPRMIVPDAVA